MSEAIATAIVNVVLAYLSIGVVFAVPFLVRGAGRIDEDARGASLGFRVVVFPGVAALWPLLALRWLRADVEREESSPHRRAARREEAGA